MDKIERLNQIQPYSQAAGLVIIFLCIGVLKWKWLRKDEGTYRFLLFLIFVFTFGGILIS